MRSLLIPGLLIGLIALPFLLSENAEETTPAIEGMALPSRVLNSQFESEHDSPFQLASTSNDRSKLAESVGPAGPAIQMEVGSTSQANDDSPASTPRAPVYDENGQLLGWATDPYADRPNEPGETFLLPGTATGPDLEAPAMPYIPNTPLEEIFRLEVTPAWVQQRWNRVSQLSDGGNLQMMRVALVSGTSPWDIHGALTYYFDQDRRCQRVSFRGWTANPKPLVQFSIKQLRLQREPSDWLGVFTYHYRGQPTAGLILKLVDAESAPDPSVPIAIALELAPHRTQFGLTGDFLTILQDARPPR